MLRVSGVSKTKIFEGKYEAKLEFPEEGERVETKKPSMGGGYGYFLECTIYCFASCTEGGIPKLLTPHPTPCMVPRSHLKLRIQCVVNYKMSVLHWGAKPRTGRWLLSFTGIYNMVVLCFFGLDMYPLSQLLTQLWLRYEESITNIITWKMKILKTYYWCKLRVVPENIHPPPTVRIFFTFETPLPPWNFQ